MDIRLLHKFVNKITKNKIGKQEYLKNILFILSLFKRNSFLTKNSDFEMSCLEKKFSLRFVNLFFYDDLKRKKMLFGRKKQIKSIVKKINKKMKTGYSLNVLERFLDFNDYTEKWAVQIGFDFKKSLPKVKIYLSIWKEKFNLKLFCEYFNLNFSETNRNLGKLPLDTVAIDLSYDGKYNFKFYPYLGEKNGKLIRISENSQKISEKNWIKFEKGLFWDDFKRLNTIKIPSKYKKFIKENNFKIHYFCKENGKKSIYFR